MEYNVLTHHGIKGQKWGVRRFQTKSGGLTSAGRKRYGVGKEGSKSQEAAKAVKESAKSAVTTAKQKEPKVHEDYKRAHTKKPVESLSDKELKDINTRLQAEKTYRTLNPEKESFAKKVFTKYFLPEIETIGKEYAAQLVRKGQGRLEDMLKKKKGTNEGNDEPQFDPIKPNVKNGKKGKTDDADDSSDGNKGPSPFDIAWATRKPNPQARLAPPSKSESDDKKNPEKEKKTPEKETYDGPIEVHDADNNSRSSNRSSRAKDPGRIFVDDFEDVNNRPVKSMAVDIFRGNPSVSDVVNVFQGVKAKADTYAPQASLGQAFVAGLLPPPSEDRR